MRTSFHWSSHCVFIVFNHKNSWESPKSSHVWGFINLTLVCSSISEHRDTNILLLLVLHSKRNSNSDRDLSSHNSIPSIEIILWVVVMHRSPFAVTWPCRFLHHLCQNSISCITSCKSNTMDSVSTYNSILVCEHRMHSSSNGLASIVEVAETADCVLFVEKICNDFHSSHLSHFSVVFQAFFCGSCCGFGKFSIESVVVGIENRHLKSGKESSWRKMLFELDT